MLAQYGQLADANAYRFSSKEWNGNSGLYYYLYRFYDPNLQRWLNRDPLGEYGSFNLYRFAQNAPCDFIDFDGLKGFSLNPYSIFCKVFFYQPTPPKPKTYCTLYSQTQTTCTYSCTIYKGDEILGGSLITRNKLPNGTCPSADSVANPPAPLPPPIPPTHTHSRR